MQPASTAPAEMILSTYSYIVESFSSLLLLNEQHHDVGECVVRMRAENGAVIGWK